MVFKNRHILKQANILKRSRHTDCRNPVRLEPVDFLRFLFGWMDQDITLGWFINPGNAIEKISQSMLDQLVVTDTIPLSEEAQACKKIRVITMAPTLAEAIRRVSNEESISAMFL